jgi:hypothetical protein
MGSAKTPREWLDNVLRRADAEIPAMCQKFIENPGTLLQKLPPMRQRVIDALGAVGGQLEVDEELFAQREGEVRSALAEAPGKAPADERKDRFIHHVATIYALAENSRTAPPQDSVAGSD